MLLLHLTAAKNKFTYVMVRGYVEPLLVGVRSAKIRVSMGRINFMD